jgi:hypothetical protein
MILSTVLLLCEVYSFQAVFCCFLHFAHRAFCAARIRPNAAADSVLFRLAMETTFPLAFAQRARCAAAIRGRPAADMVLPLRALRVPLSTEIALLRRSSWTVRRLRSCSS